MNPPSLSKIDEIEVSLGELDPTVAGAGLVEQLPPPLAQNPPSPPTIDVIEPVEKTNPKISAATAAFDEEGSRASSWSIVLLYLCMVVVLLLPLLDGNLILKRISIAALASLGVVCAWVWYTIQQHNSYTPKVFRIFGWTAAVVSLPITLYLGVLSPTPIVITLGITFFAFSMDLFHACAISLFAIFGYATMGALITFGVVDDPGVFAPSNIGMGERLFMLVMVPSVLLSTLWLSRRSRESMHHAILTAAEATQLAQQKENELVEARHDLEKALKAGSGQSGRYTRALAGSYLLENIVARGAVGEIYRATHDQDGSPAAVKVLQAAALYRSTAVTRFIREGNIARRIQSPHVVKIHEVGEMGDGLPYLAMEWLEGEDLGSVLRRQPKLDLESVRQLLQQVGEGIRLAHEMNIIHRDIKPSNLFRTASSHTTDSHWKILDFGVSKLTDSEGTLTRDGLIGTPGYMSPEQARGHDSDHRSDIFSVGAVLYRTLTGHTPFTASNLPQTLFRIVYVNPKNPNKLAKDLPEDISRVLALALAKKPDDRFKSIQDLVDAFEDARANNLSQELRHRADELLLRSPWNANLSEHPG